MIQIFQLYVFILAGFVGFIIIQRVPPLLHTPLMSATNAISGISLVGAIVAAGGQYGRVSTILGFVAVVCAATNVTAGFLITVPHCRTRPRRTFSHREAHCSDASIPRLQSAFAMPWV